MRYVIKSPVSTSTPLQFSSLGIVFLPFYPPVASFHLAFGCVLKPFSCLRGCPFPRVGLQASLYALLAPCLFLLTALLTWSCCVLFAASVGLLDPMTFLWAQAASLLWHP